MFSPTILLKLYFQNKLTIEIIMFVDNRMRTRVPGERFKIHVCPSYFTIRVVRRLEITFSDYAKVLLSAIVLHFTLLVASIIFGRRKVKHCAHSSIRRRVVYPSPEQYGAAFCRRRSQHVWYDGFARDPIAARPNASCQIVAALDPCAVAGDARGQSAGKTAMAAFSRTVRLYGYRCLLIAIYKALISQKIALKRSKG